MHSTNQPNDHYIYIQKEGENTPTWHSYHPPAGTSSELIGGSVDMSREAQLTVAYTKESATTYTPDATMTAQRAGVSEDTSRITEATPQIKESSTTSVDSTATRLARRAAAASTGRRGEPAAPLPLEKAAAVNNEKYGLISKQQLYDQVAVAGGWVDWLTGGPFTNDFGTLGAAFGEEWMFGRTFDLGQLFQINYWAQDMCTFRQGHLSSSKGAIVTSPSGKSYAHMEGEQVTIDPCQGVESVEQNARCEPYYAYKISGEIAAAEVPMTFRIYIIDAAGNEVDLYNDPPKIALKKGELLSLAGANMYYFENTTLYTKICIHFDNILELREVFGAVFGTSESLNPLCQKIVVGEKRDYQEFEPEEGTDKGNTASRPRGRPSPAKPTNSEEDTYNDAGISPEDRPGMEAE